MTPRRGPDLPYKVVAGVTPWGKRWVAATAKLAGSTFAPEPPKVYDSFTDVLDERPAFDAIVINAPVGYVERRASGVRACDREARALLGRRGITVRNAPSRAMLLAIETPSDEHLDVVSAVLLPRYREVALEMSPYRQRMVYEGNPELSFFQLNGNVPLKLSKRNEAGREERRAVLLAKIPGINKIIDTKLDHVPEKHLLDAAALLWSARRVFGHAARRLPEEAVWDSEGLRMELVY